MKATPLLAGRKLLEYGPDDVIIKKGGNGSLVISKDEEFEIPAFKVSVKDTTGAGDSFHGGFIWLNLRIIILRKQLFLQVLLQY